MTEDELADIAGIAHARRKDRLTISQLLERTRYRDLRPQFSVALLQRYLRRHPEHVKEWQMYSEDKRTDGIYFRRFGPLWGIGELRISEDGKLRTRRSSFFLSRSRACATFILRELDEIASYNEPHARSSRPKKPQKQRRE